MFAFMGGGRTLRATAITSSYRYRRRTATSDRAHFVPFPYCFRCPYDKKREDCGLYCVKQFEKNFETEYNSFWDAKAKEPEFAAFYVEAIQGTGGYVIPPPEYFPALKKVLDERGILLVDDEIQMGFFRAGKFWAIENFNVEPDIIVFGKALTNGLNPLSGIWAREELINPGVFPPGSTHSTFSSNTLGTAVGLEAVRMMLETDYEELVNRKGAYFLAQIKQLQKKFPKVIGDTDGMGLALRIEIRQADGPGSRADRHNLRRGDEGRSERPRQEDGPRAGRRRVLQERVHPRAELHDHQRGDRSGNRGARSADSALRSGSRVMSERAAASARLRQGYGASAEALRRRKRVGGTGGAKPPGRE